MTSVTASSVRGARRDRGSALSAVPVAWPTLLLTVVAWICFLGAVGIGELAAWWLAVPGVVLGGFIAFTPMHDAAHRSVAKARRVSEVTGRLAGVILLAPFPAFRWIHLEHHKHTNEAGADPDFYSGAGPRWQLPLRWLTQDLHYYWVYLRQVERPRRERLEAIGTLLGSYVALAALALAGHWQFVVAWLIGARLAIALLAFAFDYLPHAPHDVVQKQDRYRATTLIDHGWLTPVLLYQNYHLIHHLYPGVPFYRYARVFEERRADLVKRGARKRKLFGAAQPLDDRDS
ncbi:MAG: fatty acid desaturase [Myxococcales bacterium]|nr:fatty acid desaturase [Myxococcales bacterium]